MEIIKCECCGQPLVDYKVTLTKRNLIWLYALGYIGKHVNADRDYWTNYKDVHALVGKHWGRMADVKNDFGEVIRKEWRPMVVTSYGIMSDKPWELIESFEMGKHKTGRNGDWRLSTRGIDFINNKLQVPEIAYFHWDGCYKSNRLIYANELKGINFDELVNLFNSF